MRDQYTFYRSFWDAMRVLPKKEQLSFVTAICAYVFDDEETELTGGASAAFMLVRPVLDKASKRASSGRVGGSKREANVKQIASKTRANGKQTTSDKEREKEVEREMEVEEEDSACAREGTSAPAASVCASACPDDDLTGDISRNIRAQALLRRYGLPDQEATLCALLDDMDMHGEAQVETALRNASLADHLGGLSVNFYRAFLPGAKTRREAEASGGTTNPFLALAEKYRQEERRT